MYIHYCSAAVCYAVVGRHSSSATLETILVKHMLLYCVHQDVYIGRYLPIFCCCFTSVRRRRQTTIRTTPRDTFSKHDGLTFYSSSSPLSPSFSYFHFVCDFHLTPGALYVCSTSTLMRAGALVNTTTLYSLLFHCLFTVFRHKR